MLDNFYPENPVVHIEKKPAELVDFKSEAATLPSPAKLPGAIGRFVRRWCLRICGAT